MSKKCEAAREMFKGPTGTYDVTRILFGFGGFNGVVAPIVFQAWEMAKTGTWDPLAFCTAYGGMLAAILAGGGIATATKDKGVASAMNTTPSTPPLGGQP